MDVEVGLFGARGKAKELGRQVQDLHAQNAQLRHDLERLGALDVVELENRRRHLTETIAAEQGQAAEADRQARATAREAAEAEQRALAEVRAEAAKIRAALVVTRDDVVLQEVGVYDYPHPLDDSVAFKAELERVKDRIKTMNRKDGGAVLATTGFTMNGSVTQGRKMVREFSKLLQRAYNNEADNLVRSMRPYKLDSARDRLSKSRQTIERLGQSMDIHISAEYHRLRLTELELTADHINKLAEEKEREREERSRLREERKAQAELDRERERLAKEQQHYLNALAKLEAAGNTDGLQDLRDRLAQIGQAIEDVDFRAANVRAGYVYVISNLGSFGERMVKVGMTRRLEPLDRVRELSDASVPFNFDVHAIHFSNDAVGVEAELHRRLAAQRVNRVNHRREFFYATPAEVRDLLAQVTGNRWSTPTPPRPLNTTSRPTPTLVRPQSQVRAN
ncbi:DUF4041 domain-containing protein [Solicola sp. PLA-1-18]|uniref:DUF4041 domain-containing protein n=1 Tax=Solicola sp. PLA-1-18 TaxID=3380532 RepID=UPI003B76A364